MTCTSCSSRVQRKLNKVEGVDASVNFSTETASVDFDPGKTDRASLIQVVRDAGYDAFAMSAAEPGADDTSSSTASSADSMNSIDLARENEAADLKRTVIWSALLAVPIMLVSMIPALQFTYWQWAVFTLTTLVFVVAGAPFHRATWTNLRHGAVTMDTLISLGTTAAYLWAVWALFLGNAGEPGMTMEMHIFSRAGSGSHGMDEIYLETVAVAVSYTHLTLPTKRRV